MALPPSTLKLLLIYMWLPAEMRSRRPFPGIRTSFTYVVDGLLAVCTLRVSFYVLRPASAPAPRLAIRT